MTDIHNNFILPGHVITLTVVSTPTVVRLPRYIVVDKEDTEEDENLILFPYREAANLYNLPIWERVAVRYSSSRKDVHVERVSDYSIEVVCSFFRHLSSEYLKMLTVDSENVFDELCQSLLVKFDRQYFLGQYMKYSHIEEMAMYRWKLDNKGVPTCSDYPIGTFIQVIPEQEYATYYYLVIQNNENLVFPFDLCDSGLTSDTEDHSLIQINLQNCKVSAIPEESIYLTPYTKKHRNEVFSSLLHELEYRKLSLQRVGDSTYQVQSLIDKYSSVLSKLQEESK